MAELSKEQLLQLQQKVQELSPMNTQELCNMLKNKYPDWYASLRIPMRELQRRLKEFEKEIPNGE